MTSSSDPLCAPLAWEVELDALPHSWNHLVLWERPFPPLPFPYTPILLLLLQLGAVLWSHESHFSSQRRLLPRSALLRLSREDIMFGLKHGLVGLVSDLLKTHRREHFKLNINFDQLTRLDCV